MNRGTIAGVLASGAILGIAGLVGTAAQTAVVTTGSVSTSSSTAADSGTTNGTATDSAATTAADGTYTGDAVSTRWGDVQVQVTISGGVITEVTALQLTDADGKSVQISNRAAPVLREEVLQAQSASVSTVSGATYTSAAYLSSLQSALDQAGF